MATEWKDADGTVASVDSFTTRGGTRYRIVFTYKADGEWYGGTFTTNEQYAVGDALPVEYDPRHPERNKYVVDEKRMRLAFAVLAVLVSVVAIYFMLRPAR